MTTVERFSTPSCIMTLVEQDCRLRTTDNPVTPISEWSLAENPAALPSNLTIYYLCGECGIVVGRTPILTVHPGMVISCHNCGAHNTL